MQEVSKRYQEQLKEFKENVQSYSMYWKENSDRYYKFMDFVYHSTIDQDDIALLKNLGKPTITFNTLTPYISRLCGEVGDNLPSVNISADPDSSIPLDEKTIEVTEGHMRHILDDANRKKFTSNIFRTIVSGGFGAAMVWTDYKDAMSLDQCINFDFIEDPNLCGWDIYAKHPNKIDGDYCFVKYPKTKENLEIEYPGIDFSGVEFIRDVSSTDGQLNWFYSDNKNKIAILCEYYKREKKRKKIVQLTNGKVMFYDEYQNLVKEWNESGNIQQEALIVKERMTIVDKIVRYVFIGNKILERNETSFKNMPIIYIDGCSVTLRKNKNGPLCQFTRPLVYDAYGMQRLKDFAGQTIGAYLEDSVRSQWVYCIESMPTQPEYLDFILNPQKGGIITYHAYDSLDPNKQLPPPREIQRPPAPAEIMNVFIAADKTVQTILGSYDAALGINDNQLSGRAIRQGSIQTNAVFKPYLENLMQGITAILQANLDILPVYYNTPRTIPIINNKGEKTFVKINDAGQPSFDFSNNPLNVVVEAGSNFKVEQDLAVEQIAMLAKAIPGIAEFIKDKGIPAVLDNINFRGSDILKKSFPEYQQEQKMLAQQNPNPMMLKIQNDMKETEIREKKLQSDTILGAAKIGLLQQAEDTDRMKLMMAAGEAKADNLLRKERSDTERYHSATELAIKSATAHHKHENELKSLEHNIKESIKP